MKKKSPENGIDINSVWLDEMVHSRNDMADALAMTYSRRIGKTELTRRLVATETTSNASVGTTLTVDMLQDAATALRNAEPPHREDNGLWGGIGSYRREYEERARAEQAYRQFASMARVEVEHRDREIVLHCMDQHYAISRRSFDEHDEFAYNHLMKYAKDRVIRAAWDRHGMAGLEPRHDVDLRPGAVNYVRDHFVMHGAGGSTERPEKLETYVERKHMVSECGRFRAESLFTNQRLWDESEAMRNCVYRSYRVRVKEGGYALYHIDAPHLGKRSGFTVGLIGVVEHERCADRMVTLVRKSWKVDQIKGKANSTCPDRELQNFCDWIAKEMGESREEVRQRKSWWGGHHRGMVDISGW